MVKNLFLAVFLCLGASANGQVLISILLGDKLNSGKLEFGLEGGWSLSTLAGIDPSKAHSNFDLGFYFDFGMQNPSWKVSTGVRVKSTMGTEGQDPYSLNDTALDEAFNGGSVTTKISYFNVPVMMKYMFKNKIYAQGGIQLGLRYKAKDEFTNTVNDKEDLVFDLNTKNKYHPLDGGLIAGLGYRLVKGNGMNLGIQYYYGLVDIRISNASPNQYNRVLYVNAGIPIGKGKAAAKASEKTE